MPNQLHAQVFRQGFATDGQRAFLGVTPWSPAEDVENSEWMILPVRQPTTHAGENQTPDIVQIPHLSAVSHSILPRLETNPYAQQKKRSHGHKVKIIEVQPLTLDTIYIVVDGDALRKHEEVQSKFRGGFVAKANKPAKTTANERRLSVEDELIESVREALDIAIVARQGDLLPLPLPAHPITHVPFPPAQIVLCEPVGQGLPTPETRIVINRTHNQAEAAFNGPLPVLSSSKSLTDFDITDGDGTSNEAYHSALEDGDTSEDQLDGVIQDAESDEDSGSSDGSSDEMISMSTPAIAKRSSMMSSKATATPRGHANKVNGMSTPGSIFSNMTSMTSRRDRFSRGRLFKAHSLQSRLATELLHPSPTTVDDDECRVFVDVKVLVRLGCFSGDWVKVAAAKSQQPGHLDNLMSLRQDWDYRPVRIFGLPDLQLPSVPRNVGGVAQSRRPSNFSSSGLAAGMLDAWFPPVLLVNLGNADSVNIWKFENASTDRPSSRSKNGPRKLECSTAPPTANEMTLLRISTPLTTEKAIQNGLFSSLKRHFEQRRRIVRDGDMIAVPLDAKTSRLFGQSEPANDIENDLNDILAFTNDDRKAGSITDIAWFKIGSITGPEPLEASDMAANPWNSVACIEPNETRMRQAGSEQCKLPIGCGQILQYYQTISLSPHLSRHSLTSVPRKLYIPTIQRRIGDLMAAATSPRALHLKMAPVCILLHSSQRNIGKATLAQRAADEIGLHTFSIDSYDLLDESDGGADVKAEALLKARTARAVASGPALTAILLRHIEALTADRMVMALKDILKDMKVMIATTTELSQVAENIRSLFTHEIEVFTPDEGEREGLLREIVAGRQMRVANDVHFAAIAVKTAALVAGNLIDIVDRALIARRQRLERLITARPTTDEHKMSPIIQDVLISGGEAVRCVTKADFELAVEAARKNFADSIGAPKIPNVSWDDVGGLEYVKDAVLETIQLPLERPELFAKGMKKRSGILFYGPPGTGKTLLAKAIATEFSLNFFSVKGPELLNMYIGESEANVRRVFQRARDARPCVVFFDELDSVAPKRGNQGDSGGVMDRIVSQLLAELDGMSDGEEGAGGVFVIGATNRPDLLDPALLRPGRFDKMLYLGVSDTHAKQLTILKALTRKFSLHQQLSLARVAEKLPFTYTGADLYALCSDAMLKAITRQASAVDAKIAKLPNGPVTTAHYFDHLATPEDIAVMVTEEDFAAAQRELVPSVR